MEQDLDALLWPPHMNISNIHTYTCTCTHTYALAHTCTFTHTHKPQINHPINMVYKAHAHTHHMHQLFSSWSPAPLSLFIVSGWYPLVLPGMSHSSVSQLSTINGLGCMLCGGGWSVHLVSSMDPIYLTSVVSPQQ